MIEKIILFSGASSVGKTAVMKTLIPLLKQRDLTTCICKIDCIHTEDEKVYKKLNVKCVTGLSQDICPDHYLVSNLPELWKWADQEGGDWLLVETAGLCHRCSPATELMLSGCVLDATASYRAPESFGPMLSQADFIVLTKIDMVSQAEKEILMWNIKKLNIGARLFPVDGLSGYGVETLMEWLYKVPARESFENDTLRHTMPCGVCSYCVGETRVGSMFQQGIVGKIDFGEVR